MWFNQNLVERYFFSIYLLMYFSKLMLEGGASSFSKMTQHGWNLCRWELAGSCHTCCEGSHRWQLPHSGGIARRCSALLVLVAQPCAWFCPEGTAVEAPRRPFAMTARPSEADPCVLVLKLISDSWVLQESMRLVLLQLLVSQSCAQFLWQT